MTTTERLSRIKAISFDGDMTLWDFQKVMRHSLGYALTDVTPDFEIQSLHELGAILKQIG